MQEGLAVGQSCRGAHKLREAQPPQVQLNFLHQGNSPSTPEELQKGKITDGEQQTAGTGQGETKGLGLELSGVSFGFTLACLLGGGMIYFSSSLSLQLR